MLEFEDSARSEAPPEDVWKILYDPARARPNENPPERGMRMGREGLEPSTLGLRVPCSTN